MPKEVSQCGQGSIEKRPGTLSLSITNTSFIHLLSFSVPGLLALRGQYCTTFHAWGSCLECRGSRRHSRLDRTRACRSVSDGHDTRTAAAEGHGRQFGRRRATIPSYNLVARLNPHVCVVRCWPRSSILQATLFILLISSWMDRTCYVYCVFPVSILLLVKKTGSVGLRQRWLISIKFLMRKPFAFS